MKKVFFISLLLLSGVVCFGQTTQKLRLKAEEHLRLYDTPEALSKLDEAYNLSLDNGKPTDMTAAILTLMGEAWLQLNNSEKSKRCLSEAERCFRDKSSLDYARLLIAKGDYLKRSGRNYEAIQQLEFARNCDILKHNDPEKDPVPHIVKMNSYLIDIDAYVAEGNLISADSLLEMLFSDKIFIDDYQDFCKLNALNSCIRLLTLCGEDYYQRVLNKIKEREELISFYKENGIPISLKLMRDYNLTEAEAFIIMGFSSLAKESLNRTLELQRQISRYHLAYLNEEDQFQMWGNEYRVFNSIFMLNDHSLKNDFISKMLYDAALLNKGLLFNASANLSDIIMQKGDDKLKNDFAILKRLQNDAIYTYNKASRDSIDWMEKSVLQRARQLGNFMSYTDLTWTDIRNALKENEAAVEFVMADKDGSEYYAAVLITKDAKAPILINGFNKKLDNIWHKFNGLLPNNTKVYFSPVGELCIKGIEYQTASKNSQVLACDKYDLRRVTSTRVLVDRRKSNNTKKTAAIFYNIDYSPLLSEAESVNGFKEWGALSGTKIEGKNIRTTLEEAKYDVVKIFEKNGAYDGKGTEKDLYNLSAIAKGKESPKIIHFATHGFYYPYEKLNTVSMLRCGLVLHNANKSLPLSTQARRDDNIATAAEIATMNLSNTDFVALSACQTAQGKTIPEGIMGLQRALKKAGVGAILMTTDRVNDSLTAQLLTEFYKYYVKEGLSPTKALRKAQQGFMESGKDTIDNWKRFIILDDITNCEKDK